MLRKLREFYREPRSGIPVFFFHPTHPYHTRSASRTLVVPLSHTHSCTSAPSLYQLMCLCVWHRREPVRNIISEIVCITTAMHTRQLQFLNILMHSYSKFQLCCTDFLSSASTSSSPVWSTRKCSTLFLKLMAFPHRVTY